MITVETKSGQIWTETDFARALSEAFQAGICEVAPGGRTRLKISKRDALKIVNDKTTDFPKEAVICWLLDECSRSQNESEADDIATVAALAKHFQQIPGMANSPLRPGFPFGGGANENN